MSGHVQYLQFVMFTVICFASLLVFQSGFLLKRVQLQHKSVCSDVSLSSSSCWVPARFDRAVLILIDALRHDFISAMPEEGKPYTGHMPFTRSLLERGAFLTTAVADPPTTTLQRLKALGTGGLPTFIDASENFSSDSEVEEDSFLSQLRSRGKNATLLGDDTWLSLYPNGFTRSFALPSFDINDIHTVDNYILEHLDAELSRRDWSFLVAHFLGVDHVGHKYGPTHPEMAAKLRQMDRVVRQVANSLNERTVLIVMGDHGMTVTGDHGGDSSDEVSAAFLVYAKGESFQEEKPAQPVQQIDMVPSLSLLLDLPIPFSNLGSLIPDLFPASQLPSIIEMNAMQIARYYATYESLHGSAAGLSSLSYDLPHSTTEQLELIRRLQSSLRSVWTHFDVPLMRASLLTLADSVLSLALPPSPSALVIRSGHLLLLLASSQSPSSAAPSILTCSLCLSFIYTLSRLAHSLLSPAPALFSLSSAGYAAVLLHSLSALSNSYIVWENPCLRFLLVSLLICSTLSRYFGSSTVSALTRLRTFSAPMLRILAALCFLRADTLFHRCREEEQESCTQYSPPLNSASLPLETLAYRMLAGIGSSVGLVLFFRRRKFSPDHRHSLAESLSYPCLLLILLCFSSSLLPPQLSTRYATVLRAVALVVYSLSLLSLILSLALPSPASSLLSLSLPLLLLLGEGIAPSLLSLLITLFAIRDVSEDLRLSLLSLMIPYSFYALGHSPTLSAIPWQAAFVGLSGAASPHILSASLILVHLFGFSIILCFSLPLLLSPTPSVALSPYLQLAVISSCRVFCSCIAATVHRRHLMVWKIFAPHFIFTAISYLMVLLALNLAYLLIGRRLRPICD